MAHARPHPQARQRSAGDLAYPLCRRPGWGDCRAVGRRHRRTNGNGAVGSTLAANRAQSPARVTPGNAAGASLPGRLSEHRPAAENKS